MRSPVPMMLEYPTHEGMLVKIQSGRATVKVRPDVRHLLIRDANSRKDI